MVDKDCLRIAMIGHKRIPSREGGVEVVVEQLSTRMVKLGHNVTCYNRSGHHVSGKEFDTQELKEYQGVKLKNVLTFDFKGLAAMSSSFFAAFRAAFGKYDVVHFHAEGPCAMLWIAKLFGKRCVATVHGLDHQRAKWGKFARNYILFGEKVAVKFADEIIVLSEGVKDYFKTTYNRDTRFIPNGVNRPEIKNVDLIKSEFGLEKDGYILFLGRIVPEKGLRYLVEAFKKVDTDKKLVIAGGASDTDEFMDELKQLASDDGRIIFTGFVQGQALEELYSNAYIYTLPSDLEGMPLSLLEAMSYGNCCVVSDIAECAEVVEDKAVVFKKSDVEDLADKLSMLCSDEKLTQSYKDTAADYICNRYSWDSIVEETLKLY
jgi:glycosyltransferase involved in cell wall biosynthesis